MEITNTLYRYRNDTIIHNSLQTYDATPIVSDRYRTETIDAMVGVRYQGDFYGLLDFMRVTPDLFLVTLVMNGFTNPCEYDGTILEIKIAHKTNNVR